MSNHDPNECEERECKICSRMFAEQTQRVKIVPNADQQERRNDAFKEVLTALGKPTLNAEDREVILQSACTFFDVPMKKRFK